MVIICSIVLPLSFIFQVAKGFSSQKDYPFKTQEITMERKIAKEIKVYADIYYIKYYLH